MLTHEKNDGSIEAIAVETIGVEPENTEVLSALGVDSSTSNNIIVSLTSYPARMHFLHLCLHSLLAQTIKPQRLILWLGEEEFPHREKDLPQLVSDCLNKGLEIRWTKDIKQYKKLVPALNALSDKIIVTADDDSIYPENWLEILYNDYVSNDFLQMVYAHRVHHITFDLEEEILPYVGWVNAKLNVHEKSYLNLATGVGGILYPPGCLHHSATNEKLFMELAPTADDMFFWAMAVLNNTPIKIVKNNIVHPIPLVEFSKYEGLYAENVGQDFNDIYLQRIFTYYPEIKRKIMAENIATLHQNRGNLVAEQKDFVSADYWEERYKTGGNSGAGSYNNLMQFKARTINDFMKVHNTQSVIDFGAGDGNQLAHMHAKKYTGFDVSHSTLANLRVKFFNDEEKSFFHISEYNGHKAELGLSLDVIFHLIEDEVYHEYMERLFEAATKYVIIYSSNEDSAAYPVATHVKHRKFTRWVARQQKNWKCIEWIKNEFPLQGPQDQQITHSFSDFYIFEKING